VPVHPAASVPVTVYEVVEVKLTVIGLAEEPFDHEYVLPPLAVKTASAPEQIVGEFTEITGSGFTVTVATAVPVQPVASVPVTVYEVVERGVTVIGLVEDPFDHEYVFPPLAVKTASAPEQTVGELTEITGSGFTVTVVTAVPEHPAASVPVIVYEVVLVGVTVIGLELAPVFHEYVLPPLAVKIASAPEQTVGEFTEITGSGFMVTVATAVPVHPAASVPVTVYEVVLVGVTVNGLELAPVFHE
jgi:hypothetical protein